MRLQYFAKFRKSAELWFEKITTQGSYTVVCLRFLPTSARVSLAVTNSKLSVHVSNKQETLFNFTIKWA